MKGEEKRWYLKRLSAAIAGKKQYIRGGGGGNKFSNVDELLHPKTDFESFCMHGETHAWGMGSGAADFRIWVSRYGSGFLARYIFIRGKGLGSARSSDCFSMPVLTVHTHRHTKNTHRPMWNHSKRTQRLIFGNRIFRLGLERGVKKYCLRHLFIITVCSIAASSVRLAHKLKIFFVCFFLTHTWP